MIPNYIVSSLISFSSLLLLISDISLSLSIIILQHLRGAITYNFSEWSLQFRLAITLHCIRIYILEKVSDNKYLSGAELFWIK